MGTTTSNRGYRIPQSTDGAVNLTSYWVNLGSDIDTDVEALDTSLSGAWTNFPGVAWTGSTTNPVINNGVLSAEYKQQGKTVKYKGRMVAGSTTTFGSGSFQINYPVTPTSLASTNGNVMGPAWVFDSSTGAMWTGTIRSISTSILRISVTNAAASGDLTNTAPMNPWGTSDRFSWFLEYEVP